MSSTLWCVSFSSCNIITIKGTALTVNGKLSDYQAHVYWPSCCLTWILPVMSGKILLDWTKPSLPFSRLYSLLLFIYNIIQAWQFLGWHRRILLWAPGTTDPYFTSIEKFLGSENRPSDHCIIQIVNFIS